LLHFSRTGDEERGEKERRAGKQKKVRKYEKTSEKARKRRQESRK